MKIEENNPFANISNSHQPFKSHSHLGKNIESVIKDNKKMKNFNFKEGYRNNSFERTQNLFNSSGSKHDEDNMRYDNYNIALLEKKKNRAEMIVKNKANAYDLRYPHGNNNVPNKTQTIFFQKLLKKHKKLNNMHINNTNDISKHTEKDKNSKGTEKPNESNKAPSTIGSAAESHATNNFSKKQRVILYLKNKISRNEKSFVAHRQSTMRNKERKSLCSSPKCSMANSSDPDSRNNYRYLLSLLNSKNQSNDQIYPNKAYLLNNEDGLDASKKKIFFGNEFGSVHNIIDSSSLSQLGHHLMIEWQNQSSTQYEKSTFSDNEISTTKTQKIEAAHENAKESHYLFHLNKNHEHTDKTEHNISAINKNKYFQSSKNQIETNQINLSFLHRQQHNKRFKKKKKRNSNSKKHYLNHHPPYHPQSSCPHNYWDHPAKKCSSHLIEFLER